VSQTNLLERRGADFDAIPLEVTTALAQAYHSAKPFPHVVVDNLFSERSLRAMIRDFDAAVPSDWKEYRGGLQRKRGTPAGSHLPPAVQDYFNLLNSGPFLRYLTRITGITDLIPDPALHGGGMHEVEAGGGFEVHLDFPKHPRTKLDNRLVVLTYFNEDWTDDDGGALELWDMNPPKCGASILPVFGRTVIVEQSAHAAHGQPGAVNNGRLRRSAVAYFYTNGLEKVEDDELKTTYIPHAGYSRKQKLELWARLITPPVVLTGARYVRDALKGK